MNDILTLERFETLATAFESTSDLRGYQQVAHELQNLYPSLEVIAPTEDDLTITGRSPFGILGVFELTVYKTRIQVRSWKVGNEGVLGRVHDTFIHLSQTERRCRELYQLFNEVLRYTH